MASSYSNSLKIQLMANGEDSNTWGTITNTNWNLMEQAVTGVDTIVMANANYTLTNLNGISDEARNMVIIATGTTGGAGKQIIAPLVQKFYIVYNNTSDGYSVNIGASTGAVITIPNGVTAQVYCDGSNFYSAQTGSAGNFLVNGNLSVTGSQVDVGNMSIGGTLGVTGAASLNGGGTSTTPTTGDNTTKIATTAFVTTAVTNATGSLGTMSTQNANNVAITGGTLNGVSGTNSGLSVGTATNLTGSGTISSTTTGTTQALGTNNTTIATTAFALANGIPSGAIVMWSGSIASIPSGWLLCNGANGTPDLRDRFVVGAGNSYAVGATGGTADAVVVSHTHTATSVVTDPTHSHVNAAGITALNGSGATVNFALGGSGGQGYNNVSTNAASTGITVATTNTATGVSGTNQNLPPYYALAYIMKS